MFSKAKSYFSGLIAVIALSGCLQSENPLPSDKRDYSQSPFIGSWTSEPSDPDLDTDYLVIFHEDGADHLTAIFSDKKEYDPGAQAVEEAKQDKDAELYHVTFSMLDGVMFANVLMLEDDDPSYVIGKVSMKGAQAFHFWGIKDESIKALVQAQGISQEGSSMITLEADALAGFVSSFKAEDYQEPNIFERVQ